MNNLFNLSNEEKNRIRGLHLTESKDKRFTSVLCEQKNVSSEMNCVIVNFKRGESQIQTEVDENIVKLMKMGMRGDRPFITVEAGTSGTGSDLANRRVMSDRIGEALKLVIDAAKDLVGGNNLPYSESAIMNRVQMDSNYNTIEPGSVIGDEQVPTDEDDPFFNQFQYVKICFNSIDDTPNYGMLADQFMAATIEKTGLNPTDDDTVYFILDTLRDSGDFMEFNKELKNDYGMDFYEIACDRTTINLNPFMDGDTKIGPPELGGSDTTINAQLRRLGVDPISC